MPSQPARQHPPCARPHNHSLGTDSLSLASRAAAVENFAAASASSTDILSASSSLSLRYAASSCGTVSMCSTVRPDTAGCAVRGSIRCGKGATDQAPAETSTARHRAPRQLAGRQAAHLVGQLCGSHLHKGLGGNVTSQHVGPQVWVVRILQGGRCGAGQGMFLVFMHGWGGQAQRRLLVVMRGGERRCGAGGERNGPRVDVCSHAVSAGAICCYVLQGSTAHLEVVLQGAEAGLVLLGGASCRQAGMQWGKGSRQRLRWSAICAQHSLLRLAGIPSRNWQQQMNISAAAAADHAYRAA
jgi:hypothetical protein